MLHNIEIVYTTLQTLDEARALASKVISRKLAVCANIIPNCFSIYLWNKNVETDKEVYILFKTHKSLKKELKNFIKKEHPYDVPAIFTWEAEAEPQFFHYLLNTLMSD